jgi:hypothetical protein
LLESLGDSGDTLPAAVRDHLEICEGCRAERSELQDTWAALGRMAEEPSSERMRARFDAMLAGASAGVRLNGPAPAKGRIHRPALQAGLLAATLIVGLGLGAWIGSRRGDRRELDELRAGMQTMTRAVTMSLLLHQSASERLRAVGLCETAPPDEELTQALLRVVNEDPSANVRLAALDVLATGPVPPRVITKLIASFPRQSSPPVKAAMATLLLELDGADAIEAVRASALDERLPDSVRQYLLNLLAGRGKKAGTGT